MSDPDYGGNQLVWPPPGGGGNPFDPNAHQVGETEERPLGSGRVALYEYVQGPLLSIDANGNAIYGDPFPQYVTSYNPLEGGGGGSTWRPGEYELTQQDQELTQRHYYISDALAAQQEDRLRLNDEWQRAVNEGNLALSRDIENRMAANEAQRISLEYQQQTIDAALGQAQVGANVYGTQTQGRSSQLSTLATMAQAAGEAQANPWNPLGYLDLVNASGGGTPYSNATPETQGVYGNQMAQNWQNTYGAYMDRWNQGWEATNQTPQYIQDALAKMVPLQAPAAQTPAQVALARYQRSTQGEKAALAGATPEQLRLLWEAGQVR